MAPPVSLGDLPPPAQKPKRKTLVQPALPKFPTNKRKPEANGVKASKTTNDVGDPTFLQTSTNGSETTYLPLTNGTHVEETGGDIRKTEEDREKASEDGMITARAAPDLAPVSASPNDVSISAPASPAAQDASSLPVLPSVQSSEDGEYQTRESLVVPLNISDIRPSRTRERPFMFHAPQESPSPSRAPQRSMSTSTPTKVSTQDLADMHLNTTEPEPQYLSWADETAEPTPEPPVSSWTDEKADDTTPDLHNQEPTISDLPERPANPTPLHAQEQHRTLNREKSEMPTEPEALPQLASTTPVQLTASSHIDDVFVPSNPYPAQDQPPRLFDKETRSTSFSYANGSSLADQVDEAVGSVVSPTKSSDYGMNGHEPSPDDYRPPRPRPDDSVITTVEVHMTRIFSTREWADWTIQVTSPSPAFPTLAFHAHGMVIARSPTIRALMRQRLVSNTNNLIIISPDRYIQPPAFETALRFLYTEELLTKDGLEQTFTMVEATDRQTREYQLDCALSYWMSGSILGLQAVAERAYKLVSKTVQWDLVEIALQQALALDERSLKMPSDVSSVAPSTPKSGTAVSQNSPFKSLASASEDQFASAAPTELFSGYQYPAINEAMSRSIKRLLNDFIISRLDLNSFEAEIPPSIILRSYLPDTHEYSNTTRHTANPALAGIRFGEMPIDEPPTPLTDMPTSVSLRRTTASVLMSLTHDDFADFCKVLREHQLSLETFEGQTQTWISQVVAEREERRKRVLNSKTVSNQERLSKEPIWRTVGWEERIESSPDTVGGWDLRRNWQNFLLPAR